MNHLITVDNSYIYYITHVPIILCNILYIYIYTHTHACAHTHTHDNIFLASLFLSHLSNLDFSTDEKLFENFHENYYRGFFYIYVLFLDYKLITIF